jgi:hypothetical protein
MTIGVGGYPIRVPLNRDGVFPSEVTHEDAALLLPYLQSILNSRRSLGYLIEEEIFLLKGRWGHYLRCENFLGGLRNFNANDITLKEATELIKKFRKIIGSKVKETKKKTKKKTKTKKKRLMMGLNCRGIKLLCKMQ